MAGFDDHGQLLIVRDFIMQINKRMKQCAEQNRMRCSEQLDAGKVTAQEFALLLALTECGTLAVKEIAAKLPGISLSTLTRMLDKMEENGFITRALDPDDRRSFLITGTYKTQQAAESYKRQIDRVAESMLAGLTAEERLTLIELFCKIESNLRSEQ